MKVEEHFSDCRIPHTLYLVVSASGLGHGKFHPQAMHVQDPIQAQPSIDANGASHSRCEELHSEWMHGNPAQSLERRHAKQSEVQSEAGARFHADSIRIPVFACCVLIAQCQVLTAVLFTFSSLVGELS